jgi:hypothetical protein
MPSEVERVRHELAGWSRTLEELPAAAAGA